MKPYDVLFFVLVTLSWVGMYFGMNALADTASVFVDYETVIDHIFPLVPFFVAFYISGWFLMFGPFLFVKRKKSFLYGFISLAGITASIFLLFPGTIVRPLLTGTDIWSQLLQLIYTNDPTHNLFPSSHVSIMFYNALVLDCKWIYLWFVLVTLSAIFTKQHFFLDLVGGLVTGAIAYAVYRRA